MGVMPDLNTLFMVLTVVIVVGSLMYLIKTIDRSLKGEKEIGNHCS